MKKVRVPSVLLGTWIVPSTTLHWVLQHLSLPIRVRFEGYDASEWFAYGCKSKMQSIVSRNQRFWDGLYSFFLLPDRAGRNLSHCSSELFFPWHLIGISAPECSKLWISVTESLKCIILLLDSTEQSPHCVCVRCPWSHLEIPRLKKIVGNFS